MSTLPNRALAAAGGILLDRLLGEPPAAFHPVAGFGTVMTSVEARVWQDRRAPGIAYAAVGVAIGAGAGVLVRSTTLAVALACAGRQLRTVANDIGAVCTSGDLEAARAALPSLVGRDPSGLDTSGVAAAVVESVGENSVDAVVAPVFWGVVGGAPGALAYRAINTMDAMVGHRNDRYERFGWAAARLDDVANYVPARAFASLVKLAAPTQRYRIGRTIRRDAHRHPSPNAGVAEAAVAAALSCQLGGPLRYGSVHEDRPTLGSGPRPEAQHITEATRLAQRVETCLAVGLALVGTCGYAWRAR